VLIGFFGIIFGVAIPILALQILLIDMVGEMFPLIMLTFDPPEKSLMTEVPRNPKDKILTPQAMKSILFSGAIMGCVAYSAFLISFLSNHQYGRAVTITFVSIILGQYANLLSRRTLGNALGAYLFSNKYLLFAFALSLFLIALIIYVPILNLYFHTAPLLLSDWIFPLSSFVICIFIFEMLKKRKIMMANTQATT